MRYDIGIQKALPYYMQDIEVSAEKYAEEKINEYVKFIVIGDIP